MSGEQSDGPEMVKKGEIGSYSIAQRTLSVESRPADTICRERILRDCLRRNHMPIRETYLVPSPKEKGATDNGVQTSRGVFTRTRRYYRGALPAETQFFLACRSWAVPIKTRKCWHTYSENEATSMHGDSKGGATRVAPPCADWISLVFLG